MFKGPNGRGSLAGTGLKVRVSGGFKGPSRRSMPSNGSRPATWSQMVRSPTYVALPAFFHPRVLQTDGGLNVKMDFLTPLARVPSFSDVLSSFFRNGRSTDKPLSLPSLATPLRTLITHLDAGRRRENEGKTSFDICFGSHCASYGERRCVAVVRNPWTVLSPLAYVISTFNLPL